MAEYPERPCEQSAAKGVEGRPALRDAPIYRGRASGVHVRGRDVQAIPGAPPSTRPRQRTDFAGVAR